MDFGGRPPLAFLTILSPIAGPASVFSARCGGYRADDRSVAPVVVSHFAGVLASRAATVDGAHRGQGPDCYAVAKGPGIHGLLPADPLVVYAMGSRTAAFSSYMAAPYAHEQLFPCHSLAGQAPVGPQHVVSVSRSIDSVFLGPDVAFLLQMENNLLGAFLGGRVDGVQDDVGVVGLFIRV